MKIKVPSKLYDTLGYVTGSIIIDGLKETVTARCGSLYANAATLGFVRDMVNGDVTDEPEAAKKEYALRITKKPLPGFYKNELDEDTLPCCVGKPQVEVNEETDLEEFTDKQIERLRKEYESLRGKETGINPEKFKRLRGMMRRFPKASLLKLAKADIPILTTGAKASLVINHGMKWSQLPEELVPYIELEELSEGKFKEIDLKVIDRIKKMMKGPKKEKESLANLMNYLMPPEVVDMVRDRLNIKSPRGKIKISDFR